MAFWYAKLPDTERVYVGPMVVKMYPWGDVFFLNGSGAATARLMCIRHPYPITYVELSHGFFVLVDCKGKKHFSPLSPLLITFP